MLNYGYGSMRMVLAVSLEDFGDLEMAGVY